MMRPRVTRAVQSLVSLPELQHTSRTSSKLKKPPSQPWICPDCRFEQRAQELYRQRILLQAARRFSTTRRKCSDETDASRKQTINSSSAGSTITTQTPSPTSAALPSQIANRRWQLSKDLTRLVDGILARASIASQHINVYTGTDYSGIESLRKDILAQEQTVRTHHAIVSEAKAAHHAAITAQAAAQKEVVSLLERKSSWLPADLERYMTLVRSEHVNDQAVQVAKDALAAAERELEDARATLERLERKQYHEEQIWSDTIRRNSTWVTFGLMGVNILLLLAQILVFEPWRRRKIVRDVKDALDEKTVHPPAKEQVQAQVDELVEPAGVAIETVEQAAQSDESAVALPPDTVDNGLSRENPALGQPLGRESMHSRPQTYREHFVDLFSDRMIQIKQVELTTAALQGTATGIAAMGLLFILLRQR